MGNTIPVELLEEPLNPGIVGGNVMEVPPVLEEVRLNPVPVDDDDDDDDDPVLFNVLLLIAPN